MNLYIKSLATVKCDNESHELLRNDMSGFADCHRDGIEMTTKNQGKCFYI